MSILIIKEISLFYPQDETAKHVEFSYGKNVITSSIVDGNNVGKTTILKSIYHTLGADCKFDAKWPGKDIISVVVADVGGKTYRFYRHDKLCRVFDDDNLLCEVTHKSDLAEFYQREFGLAVYLPNRSDDELELAPPAFSFVLNYLDKPMGPHFTSFEGLGQYTNVKDTIIFNHLGAFDQRYYQLKKQQEQLVGEKSESDAKLVMLSSMIQKINSEIIDYDYSTDLETLNQEVNSISRTYSNLVKTLSSLKKDIIDLSNKRIALERQLEELSAANKTTTSELTKINTLHKCPKCNSEIDDLTTLRARGYNQQAAIIMMWDELNRMLIEVVRELDGMQNKYKNKLEEVNGYKKQLKTAKSFSEDIIKQEGATQIRDRFVNDADALYLRIEGLKERISAIKKDIREYQNKINQLDEEYYPIIKNSLALFSLKEVDDSKIQKISSSFTATENNIRLVTVIWLYTLLRLKEKYNSDALVLPILIDSPSYGELDATKESELWKYVFSLPDSRAQIIITKLSFDETLEKEFNVDKVIYLRNPKYELLNREDYIEHFGELERLQSLCNE